jgi:putative transposase
MPDHVHLFARPDLDPQPLGQWVATWKALSARALVASRLAEAPVWQRDYFDRFLRSTESYGEKWDYVCQNPVRARLVARWEDWPHQGVICDLSAR